MKYRLSCIGIFIYIHSMLNAVQYYEPKIITNQDIEEDLERSISFYSGYIGSQYNNYDLASFGIELLNLGDYLIQKIESYDSRWKTALGVTVYSYVYYIYQLAFHEIGHGLKCRALNTDFQLKTPGEHGGFSKSENFWKYILRSICKFSLSGSTAYPDSFTNKEKLMIAAAGVNNEMYLAERISSEIYNEKIYGKLPAFAYLWAKLSPLQYSLNGSNSAGHDINNVVNNFKQMNINVSRSNIQTAYMLAMISGTSLAVLKAMYGGNLHRHVEPVLFGDFRIPDIFAYITSYGVSYKFVSGYKISDDLKINIGLERVMHGITKNEFSIGLQSSLRNINFESNVYIGGHGTNFDISVSGNLSKKLQLRCRFSSYSNKSLIGERHAKAFYEVKTPTSKVEKARSNTVSFGISYVY